MSSNNSAVETKNKYIENMGQDLGVVFYALYSELAWQYVKWNEYTELFGTKPSRIELINKVSPLFFRIVQDSIWDDTLLHIARLTDSIKTSGKYNLTVFQLTDLVEDEIRENISYLLKEVKNKTEFCRNVRNKKLAHKDLNLAIDDKAEPIDQVSRKQIINALASISSVLNAISHHYMDSTILFDGIFNPTGVNSLLYVLDDGLTLEKQRKERFESNNYTTADFEAKNL